MSAIILAGAAPYTEQHKLLSPSQCAMMFTLVMTHAGSYSMVVSNKRITNIPQWKCDFEKIKSGMNDWAIELSAASWQRQAGSADKGAVIMDRIAQPLFHSKWEWWSPGLGEALGDCFHGVRMRYARVCVCRSEWVAVLCVGWGGGWGIIDRLPVLEKARLGRPHASWEISFN